MTNNYIVYCAKLDDVVLYVGSGVKGREKHCISGRSGCLPLNKHFFDGDYVTVEILQHFENKHDSLVAEDLLIKELSPLYNKKVAKKIKIPLCYIGVDYPYEKVLLDLTSNEIRMYKLILDAYDYKTGYSFVDVSGQPQSVKTELSKGYKGLLAKGLVKRVRQQLYLINPSAKIHLELFDDLYDVWNKISG